MAISFQEVPKNRREPGVFFEINNSAAVRGLPGMPHSALVMGQRLAAGEAAAGQLVLITNDEQAATAFGRGSMLHAMCAAFREANQTTEMWAIAMDDAATAVSAVKTVTIAKKVGGDDFGSGTFSLWIGGKQVRVGVSALDTPAAIAAKVVAAADDPTLAMTLAVDGVDDAQINLTAKHGGSLGSLIDVRVNYFADEVLPPNMSATVALETAGATDPSIDDTLLAVEGEWWTEIVTPYLDGANYTALADFLSERFTALDQRDGIAFASQTGSVSDLFAAGLSRNSPHVSVLPHQNAPTPPWVAASAYAGVAAFQTQIDPVRQLKTLALPGVLPPSMEDRFTPEEMDMLLNKGISSTRVVGGELRLWRCVTTYRVSPAGALDPSYLDLTTMTGLAFLRWSQRNRLELRFPRHKLANDGTRFGPGQAVATPEIIRNELIGLFGEWEEAGLVESRQAFADSLIVERDSGDPNRLNILEQPDIINNLRVIAGVIQFVL